MNMLQIIFSILKMVGMVLKGFIAGLLFSFTTFAMADTSYWENHPSTQEASLLFHSWSIYSQLGEEGILDEILQRLDLTDGMFLEFSSFYDTCISNVRFLIERGWKGVLVDVDAPHFSEKRKSSQFIVPLAPILCLEEILYFKDVTHFGGVHFIKNSKDIDRNSFDEIVHLFCQNQEIDVLSIDVGGI